MRNRIGKSARSETETKPNLISLNLIFDYPVRWSKFEVLRDLVQNFYDAVRYPDWDRRFSYGIVDGKLFLTAAEVGFSYDWLVHIGASTKRDDTGSHAGYFGEGFKIASLCALRDHHWNIELCSRDWRLRVTTTDLEVDRRNLKSLAYHIWRSRESTTDTALCLSPFNDAALLESVLQSFYSPGNPLFGKKIWQSSRCAVYFRSSQPKPAGFPATFGDHGEGIIFAGYQALGSFAHPLVFCLHDYRHTDRERRSFYRMDVVKIIHLIAEELPPRPSAIVLEALKSKWYDRPSGKYDFESWYPIIRTLVGNVARSAEDKRLWQARHPSLLVAWPVKRSDLPNYNRRRQALDWLRISSGDHRLVQDSFLALGYPTLEQACEDQNGFSITREPTPREKRRIKILEELTKSLLPELLERIELPPCKIIRGKRPVWQGMTTCIPLRGAAPRFRGLVPRYRLPYVALLEGLLKADRFGDAYSTYLHELAHMFGGDNSVAFSRALSEFMGITLSRSRLISHWQDKWENLGKAD